MNKHLAHLLRPIASLALAVALAAPIALAPRADAQFGRQLPSPVSAAQFEAMLLECGMPDSTKDTALPLHEASCAWIAGSATAKQLHTCRPVAATGIGGVAPACSSARP